MTIKYIDITIFACIIYLFILFNQKKYKLLLPSVVHTITWLFVVCLIRLTINGYIGDYSSFDPTRNYDFVVPFIMGIVISSMIGFSVAHSLGRNNDLVYRNEDSILQIEYVLSRFRWILYICLLVGVSNFLFVYLFFGVDSLGDYRMASLAIERVGFWGISQRVSGHVTILATFYLCLLGYKQAMTYIDNKEFIFVALAVSSTNMAIGGRVWVITVMLAYTITYVLGKSQQEEKTDTREALKVLFIITSLILAFLVVGIVRNDGGFTNSMRVFEKFLYYTDGSRMANLAMSQFHEEDFSYELGRCEFLSKYIGSPMNDQFVHSIEHDIGLMVTVRSSLIPLYFDYGFYGGIMVWGLICFFVEYFALKLKNSTTVVGILLFFLLSRMYFQSPVFQVFSSEIPSFLWLFIIYIFRNKIILSK